MSAMDSKVTSIFEDPSVQGMSGRMRLQKHSGTSINQLITPLKLSPCGSELPLYDTRSYKKNWMEIERSHLQAYEYLCHLSEAKQWLETCLEIEIEEIDFEGFSLQNGILLAKLAKIFHPTSVKKIYFGEKLTYKHSDNIHFFLEACKAIGLPQVFLFELTDLYSRKNIPKVIYCIHALSHLLYKKGLTTNIQDLVGYLDFTDDQLQLTKKELDINGYHFPAFLNVSYDLSRAMEGTASLRIKKKSSTLKNSLKTKFRKEGSISKSGKKSNNNSIRNKSIRMIPSHTATLTTNSAINLIKNGFTDVTFKPNLGLSYKNKEFNIKSISRSNPSTLNSSPLALNFNSSKSIGLSNSLNSKSKQSRSILSHITYKNPNSILKSNSPKLSTASYRVVGKRKSRKFQMRLDEAKINTSSSTTTSDNDTKPITIKKVPVALNLESKMNDQLSSPNRDTSPDDASFITAKEVQSKQSMISPSSNSYNGSIFQNFQFKSIPSSQSTTLVKNLKSESILKRIQEFKKDSTIINKQKYKGGLLRGSNKKKLFIDSIKKSSLSNEDTLKNSLNSDQSLKDKPNTLNLNKLPSSSTYTNSTISRVELTSSSIITEDKSKSKSKSKSSVSSNSNSLSKKPIRDYQKLYGLKTLPSKGSSANLSLLKQSSSLRHGPKGVSRMTFATTQTYDANIKTTQTSPTSSLRLSGSDSLSSKFAKFINNMDQKLDKQNNNSNRKTILSDQFNESNNNSSNNSNSNNSNSNNSNSNNSNERRHQPKLETKIIKKESKEDNKLKNEELVKEKIVELSFDISTDKGSNSSNSSPGVPMLKLDSDLTNSPKTEEEILDLESDDSIGSKSSELAATKASSLIYTLSPNLESLDNQIEEEKVVKQIDIQQNNPKLELESYSFDTILIEDSKALDNNNKEEEIPFEWERYEPFIVMAQSYVRGIQQRKRKKEVDNQLRQYQASIKALQAICRGCLTRLYTMEPIYQIRTIRECINIRLVQQIQAVARKVLIRHQFLPKVLEARAQAEGFFDHLYKFQALSRRILVQRKWTYCLSEMHFHSNQVVELQAKIRGFIVRDYYRKCFQVPEEDLKVMPYTNNKLISPSVENMKQYHKLMQFQTNYLKHRPYVNNTQRAMTSNSQRIQSNTLPTIPPKLDLMTENGISCMQSFLPLLEDSDKDFAEELELEELRKSSIKKIRDIGQTENQLNELDIKIALLVRNRISLEEVLRITRMNGILGSNSGNSNNLSDLEVKENKVIPLKKLDKENRKRLEGYQQLFYLLQTQPIYLGKLLTLINQNSLSCGNNSKLKNITETSELNLNNYNKGTVLTNEYKKFFETVVLTLFGFAQNKREEFMLLNLFKTAIHIELDSINRIEDFLRGNPVFIKLAVHYNRGVKERKYLRDLLQPIIQQILQDPNIDLQTNPLLIYRALIKQEELRTGEKSLRPYDVTAEIALNDSETRSVLIQHLQQLRSITDQFIERIYSSLDQMPYGIRYIAKELKASLLKKFPNERENVIIKIVGHLVYYRYINPAIVAPESFDVIEVEISPHHRRCLAEVAKMLNQVSMGKLFNEDNIFLQPLNTYVAYTSEKFAKYIYSVTEVVEPEIQFEIDEFLDLTFTKRPVIYISPNEIYSLHKMLINNLDWLTSGDKDQLKIILKEIGDPPTISADQVLAHSKEISLHLSNRFPSINELDCELKHLFVETKRLMTYVLRVQSGSSLLEVLQKPVSQNEETRFKDLLQKERKESNENDNNSSSSQKLIDVTSMSFAQLKQIAFNNALKLEAEGMLKREDNYQVMIHSIAADIRSKSKRRISRKEELKRIYQTISNLKIKERYLIDQHSIYQDYLDSCMNMHSSKKNKKTKAIPFTKQYFHLKEISKSGSVPKFGSFKYTADRLYQKGILISIKDYLPRQFDKIDFIISSDQVGQFKVAAYYMGRKLPGEDTIISLESLLQAQFDNQLVIDLLDEEVKVNVNLLLHFINKKFYI